LGVIDGRAHTSEAVVIGAGISVWDSESTSGSN